MTSRGWQAWLNVAAGVWLVLSPWGLGFTANATALWTFVVLGVLIGAVALFVNRTAAGTEWLAVLLGAFTFVTPWLFGFTLSAIRWNAWLAGALVVVLALWAFASHRSDSGRRAMG